MLTASVSRYDNSDGPVVQPLPPPLPPAPSRNGGDNDTVTQITTPLPEENARAITHARRTHEGAPKTLF